MRIPFAPLSSRALPGAAVVAAMLLGACAKKSSGNLVPISARGKFTEVSRAAGIDFIHGFHKERGAVQKVTGGVACADYDRDGFQDIYVISGDNAGNVLYRNKGDGTFEDVSDAAKVALRGGAWCGATFADMNSDGHLDLFLAGVVDTPPCILINQRDGTFKDATPDSGIDDIATDSFSVAFGDYDRDGDLDLFLTQWKVVRGAREKTQHLWQNNGRAIFTDVSAATGISAAFGGGRNSFTDFSFTSNFVDTNSDGFLDLLITGDMGSNLSLRNVDLGGGRRGFNNITTSVLTSEHAAGAAIGDYDNDGDLDWFASGIFFAAGSVAGPLSGNRLYRNAGDGTFEDTTDIAGVRDGGWGWAASFADLDNDSNLDIVQVNGFGTSTKSVFNEFFRDPARLFLSNGDGTFTDQAPKLGFDEFGLGRGVVCFDFDRDGDLDIFVANSLGRPRLWRNDLKRLGNYLSVALTFLPGNPRGIGARIKITADGKSQIREIRCGSHYVSQNPAEAHFGLGDAAAIDTLEITWPDGTKTTRSAVQPNQLLRIQR
jgi:enediyne biosynthesis protein E4